MGQQSACCFNFLVTMATESIDKAGHMTSCILIGCLINLEGCVNVESKHVCNLYDGTRPWCYLCKYWSPASVRALIKQSTVTTTYDAAISWLRDCYLA